MSKDALKIGNKYFFIKYHEGSYCPISIGKGTLNAVTQTEDGIYGDFWYGPDGMMFHTYILSKLIFETIEDLSDFLGDEVAEYFIMIAQSEFFKKRADELEKEVENNDYFCFENREFAIDKNEFMNIDLDRISKIKCHKPLKTYKDWKKILENS